jgi:class 3 adenylate cyclase/tetratricopeptide (TPR) repeat protein
MAICPNCSEENPERARLCMMCGTALRSQPAPAQEARKTVTVLFCDLVDSTALGERLDSESLREVMDRYFAEMKRIVERHGGIVEKYIGDAVMAVFGLPRAHEDDALRAVRAASEMGYSLAALNTELDRYWGVTLANRIGVNTGEVVVGDPSSGQRLATGDTVNVAARLEQAASPGTVFVGEPTHRLVRNAVEVKAVEPLALKGKSERLPAYQVLDVTRGAEGVARRLDAPLVGREGEVSSLMEAFQRAVGDNSCHLVVVLGEAGVGKSRLVAEIIEGLKENATVLRGRCLSYGEGITFWPVAEMVREAAGVSEDDSLALARQKVTRLADGDDQTAERVAALVGFSGGSYAIEESFWAVRRLLEHLAQRQPVVVVIEDIHWAEPTLFDLIGHVVTFARTAPIFLVCSARSEVFEQGGEWLEKLSNASGLVLNPLTTEDSETLIQNVLGTAGLPVAARDRITLAAQGNPLFVEQMLSMWLDDGTLAAHDGQWRFSTPPSTVAVPPTISALLSARLDRLEQDERTVIAGASVVGQVFYRGAVEELCPPALAPHVPPTLATLKTKEFIRPDTAKFADDEAFAFRHVLIRNAAYMAMLKRTRAELHERFAFWLERVVGERIAEYQEIVGHHLERAYRYQVELAPGRDTAPRLARRAADHLGAAGRRASARGDAPAAAKLLERAALLLPEGDSLQVELFLDLGETLRVAGERERSKKMLEGAIEKARLLNDARLEAEGLINLSFLRLGVVDGALQESRLVAERAIQLFDRLGDARRLGLAWALMATVEFWQGRSTTARQAFQHAIHHSAAADNEYGEWWSRHGLMMTMWDGPAHVLEAHDKATETLAWAKERGHLRLVLSSLCALGVLEAMRGRVQKASAFLGEMGRVGDDLGSAFLAAEQTVRASEVDMLAGKSEEAERQLRAGCGVLQEASEDEFLATSLTYLAEAIYAQGRYDEADQLVQHVRRVAPTDDLDAQIRWRKALAKLLTVNGEDGETLGRESLGMVEATDWSLLRAEVRMDLAEVHCLKGRPDRAMLLVEEARTLYEQKGNVVSAAKAQRLLDELTSPATTMDR